MANVFVDGGDVESGYDARRSPRSRDVRERLAGAGPRAPARRRARAAGVRLEHGRARATSAIVERAK